MLIDKSFHPCTFRIGLPHPIKAFFWSPGGMGELPFKQFLLLEKTWSNQQSKSHIGILAQGIVTYPFPNKRSTSFKLQNAHNILPINQWLHFPDFLQTYIFRKQIIKQAMQLQLVNKERFLFYPGEEEIQHTTSSYPSPQYSFTYCWFFNFTIYLLLGHLLN